MRNYALVLILSFATAALLAGPRLAAAIPPGFSQVLGAARLDQPTAFAFKGDTIYMYYTTGPDGDIYVLSVDTGTLYKLVHAP